MEHVAMTKLCRFDDSRLGIVEGNVVLDVSDALNVLPAVRWPVPKEDLLIAHLPKLLVVAQTLAPGAPRLGLDRIHLLSPVANPPKVIGAPVNYLKHQAEADADGGINFEKNVKTIAEYGLFLKSPTSVVGVSQGVALDFPNRRTDHELELVVVIGVEGRNISYHRALEYVAGYMIGLDMTIRGTEDRSFRKSLDTFSVVGPWLTTADEIPDPDQLGLCLSVNGERRQRSSTANLIFDVRRLIEYASAYYTLHPGDLIFTGTPEGVGPVVPGDTIECSIERIGRASVAVRGAKN